MRIDELFNNGRPETLFVCRHLINVAELKEWAVEQGFQSLVPDEDFHVTIAYSKEEIKWDKSLENKSDLNVVGGNRKIEAFGDAIVLRFQSDVLHDRWAEIIDDLGASYDHPSYKPHVTLTWTKGSLDLKKITPYEGELVFGPEEFSKLNPDWKADLEEQELDENALEGAILYAAD